MRMVLLRRPRTQPARHHARRARLTRRPGHLHQVRHQTGALARPSHAGAAGPPPAIAAVPENMRAYTSARPTGTRGRSATTIYDNEIGYLFHRQFNLAGADLAPALWLTYIDPTKTLNDVETLAGIPRSRRSPKRRASRFKLILAANSVEGIQLSGQDSGWHPSLKPDVTRWRASASGIWPSSPICICSGSATSTATSSGRRLHGKLDAGWHADYVKKYLPTAIDGFYRDQKGHKLWSAAATP